MGTTSDKEHIENPAGTIETIRTEPTGASASSAVVKEAAAPKSLAAAGTGSTADMRLLKSLDAKIRELTVTLAAEARELKQQRRAPASITTPSIPSSAAIDSTQTVRPLTSLEVESCQAPRWFAIQLLLSTDKIEPAQVPNLGIFDEYKLYLVTGPEQGRLMHALRLGFFSSEIAATTVVRYLGGYFPFATIKRVSIAERERFAANIITAGKDVGAYGSRVSIEIVTPPAVRSRYAPL